MCFTIEKIVKNIRSNEFRLNYIGVINITAVNKSRRISPSSKTCDLSNQIFVLDVLPMFPKLGHTGEKNNKIFMHFIA